jgi:tetratricopeptide (TPR) repeat protein
MRLRGAAAIFAGTVLAVLLLRLTIDRADPESHWAQQIWANHPTALTAASMREVGLAASAGHNPSSATLLKIDQLAREAPLALEPFLVKGALAEKRGELTVAAQLYREASQRDPRSVAAHYLLTDLYLRTGRTEEGIRELAELSRLVPTATSQLAPAIAKFSHSPGAADQLRNIFESNPLLEQPVLSILAEDPSNADLILSVATKSWSATEPPPDWEQKLLNGMVAQGQYAQAFATWSYLTGSGEKGSAGLFNPAFRPSNAPPPFNWNYGGTDAGVAEPGNGSLQILFYGRENATLAQQTLLLSPGKYRLAVPVAAASGDPRALAWSIDCLPSKSKILNLPLSQNGGPGTVTGEFEVPAQGCNAQQIELDGTGEDSPTTVDLWIGPLTLQRAGS